MNKKTICLNMIVKNESNVIGRCLASLIDRIDYWVIVDTGSSDGTQEIIRRTLSGIPGELHERPWVHFAHNRNQALDLARGKADYFLFIDADEELVLEHGMPVLNRCFYAAHIKSKNVDSHRLVLIDNHPDWRWEGVLHEIPMNPLVKIPANGAILPGATILANAFDGCRTQTPDRFLRDAEVLLKELEQDPTNARTVFFLAQSYICAEDFKMALQYYHRRSEMGGWPEELYWSQYSVACLQDHFNMPQETVIDGYWKAHRANPTRAEPLWALSSYYLRMGNPSAGYETALKGLALPPPSGAMNFQPWVYEYALLMVFAGCAAYIGKSSEALAACEKLLAVPTLPPDYRAKILLEIPRLKNQMDR